MCFFFLSCTSLLQGLWLVLEFTDLNVGALIENWLHTVMVLNWCFLYHPSRAQNLSSKCTIVSAEQRFKYVVCFLVSLDKQIVSVAYMKQLHTELQ